MRTCTKCGCEKDDSKGGEFYYDSRTDKPRSWCKRCTNEHNLARASEDPEKHNARAKAWREANPEKWRATVRAWQKRNPERDLQNRRRFVYKIDFDALWEAQGGLCASCHRPMVRGGRDQNSACVDHDRRCCPGKKSCGKCVRGVIHRNCNLVLGYAKDDLRVLRSAIEYLERWAKDSGST